ncbi:cupin domain-containing protein [Zhihengliuella alba]|uniref:Cupin domain-containing protein n=1 Tax=Zhihengliuella alba TaxID=547018 RepID=A0ABP7DG16_9MICC
MNRSLPQFPGGTSVSDLRVYDFASADGCPGGTPHLHTASAEAYVVVGGRGEVHTVSAAGEARDPLEAGSLLWFTPGTVHRLVNHGGLHLAVVMQNAGLPEAGDAVMTFPERVLADPEAYRAAAALPDQEDERADAARARRELALEGYDDLLQAVRRDGAAALDRLHRQAAALVRPRIDQWRRIWAENVEAEVEATRRQLDALADGDPGRLGDATVFRGDPQPEPRLWGMCGRLQTWQA